MVFGIASEASVVLYGSVYHRSPRCTSMIPNPEASCLTRDKQPSSLHFRIIGNWQNVATVTSACHTLLHLLAESVELCTQNVYWHDCNDHQSNTSGFGLKILRTLPLSVRQGGIGIEADPTAAFPLQGLVRRCRITTGSVCRPTPKLHRSGYLRFTSHTRAQLQTQGRDHLQDGFKARTALSRQGLVEALPGQSRISGHLGHPLGPCD
jgi:hypothetical protein